jgi:hypothetical protein
MKKNVKAIIAIGAVALVVVLGVFLIEGRITGRITEPVDNDEDSSEDKLLTVHFFWGMGAAFVKGKSRLWMSLRKSTKK